MTEHDYVYMAVESGATPSSNPDKWDILEISYESLERFAAFVAAHEREECAKVCEAGIVQTNYLDASDWNESCENRAAAIRARGEK